MDINEAWKDTCKILMGQEIGELSRYSDYLGRYVDPVGEEHSAISGKKVTTSSADICKQARFISHDECPEYERKMAAKPLEPDSIKDVDSILEGFEGRLFYCGNIILGNSSEVERSNRCINASCVYDSTDIYDSRYVFRSCSVRYGEWIFGSNWIGETKFGIKNYETYKDVRCMETVRTYTSSDCYYTANLEGCSNCMFCFNLRNRHYSIGNVQLARDEYAKLKDKLIGEIRETLEAKKAVPSIIEIIGG